MWKSKEAMPGISTLIEAGMTRGEGRTLRGYQNWSCTTRTVYGRLCTASHEPHMSPQNVIQNHTVSSTTKHGSETISDHHHNRTWTRTTRVHHPQTSPRTTRGPGPPQPSPNMSQNYHGALSQTINEGWFGIYHQNGGYQQQGQGGGMQQQPYPVH